ncbi:MAG: cupin domain-containing protein [Gammaproteobacteria bacterium]
MKAKITGLSILLLAGAMLTAVSTAAPAAEQDFRGQKIVHLLQEPRHRPVFQYGDIYLLDVRLLAGDTSFPHTHDAPLMTTSISSGSGPTYGRVGVNLDYAEQNFTHAISNGGPGMLRIIALTSYGDALADLDSDRPMGMAVEPDVENGWFRSYRLSLAPGESTATQTHQALSFVIQVSDGKVHVSRADGITAELVNMGDWAFREPGSSYRIHNMGDTTVDVVVNEVRN